MRRFKSAAQLQRFASVHGVVQNLFRVGRHLLQAIHHRLLRTRSFRILDEVTCDC
jgi:putative transposase